MRVKYFYWYNYILWDICVKYFYIDNILKLKFYIILKKQNYMIIIIVIIMKHYLMSLKFLFVNITKLF